VKLDDGTEAEAGNLSVRHYIPHKFESSRCPGPPDTRVWGIDVRGVSSTAAAAATAAESVVLKYRDTEKVAAVLLRLETSSANLYAGGLPSARIKLK
jgi:hypothetical protein